MPAGSLFAGSTVINKAQKSRKNELRTTARDTAGKKFK